MIAVRIVALLVLALTVATPLASASETSSEPQTSNMTYAPGCIGWGDTEDNCVGVHFRGDLTKICVGRYMSEYCQGVQV